MQVDKVKLLSVVLAAALVISIGVAVFVERQNDSLRDQVNNLGSESVSQATRLEMVSILSQAQMQVEAELKQMGNTLVYASEQLSTTGLSGDQARAVISDLAAHGSFRIEAATQDLNRKMITVEPAAYKSSEGKIIGPQRWLNINPDSPILPSMTLVLPLIVGFNGVSLVAPVFDVNKNLIGTVSIAFNHLDLLNATITPLIKDTAYSVTVTQTNSTIIYDTDTSQIGKDLTSPIYANYPELLSFVHRVTEESSGYGTYSFSVDAGSDRAVHKECFWTTINAYGQEWRLALIHALDA